MEDCEKREQSPRKSCSDLLVSANNALDGISTRMKKGWNILAYNKEEEFNQKGPGQESKENLPTE
jgi:hypothetical protein